MEVDRRNFAILVGWQGHGVDRWTCSRGCFDEVPRAARKRHAAIAIIDIAMAAGGT
ncbi:MAG: hypothetical protein KYX69_22780 [Sphingomonas sp.]|uniref:hypothetical protein n=1 Tax=Sphingomonas sp. TaxID=28214 RepID=UPI0026041FF9|nr:hypothetical protein [Sphingomonas sp.]MDK2770531.1 hypothetical protein [Sphingomonas sp.]